MYHGGILEVGTTTSERFDLLFKNESSHVKKLSDDHFKWYVWVRVKGHVGLCVNVCAERIRLRPTTTLGGK